VTDDLTVIENVVTGDGNDTLTGNDADNQLVGMRGTDFYWGGDGDDLFIFYDGNGIDLIGDFTASDDVIGLYGFGFTSMTDLTLVQDGNDTVIDLGDGDQITLAMVDKLDLAADDFAFV
jgi:Ca2+-binding RTX toxin-like protein